MAFEIKNHLYRVAVDKEHHFEYVSAKDTSDLIQFLVDEYVGNREVFGVKELGHDGFTKDVTVITDPLYQTLSQKKLQSNTTPLAPKTNSKVTYSLEEKIAGAKAASSESSKTFRNEKDQEIAL